MRILHPTCCSFLNPEITVDGGADEGPAHVNVQYNAFRHMTRGTRTSLVTARAAGSSYLNPVERLNGAMGYEGINLFIPLTLLGSSPPAPPAAAT
jgi:hypothetical protein